MKLTYRLQPGEVITLNNRRILHGKQAFQLNGGVRHLQVSYCLHLGPWNMLMELTHKFVRVFADFRTELILSSVRDGLISIEF